MNKYDQLLYSLTAEFKLRAHPLLRSVWADLMELEEAMDEPKLRDVREQARQRILALGQAACAANARDVQAHSQALAQLVTTVTPARDADHHELFDTLYQKMRELTEALYATQATPPVSGRASHPTEAELVESCVD